MKSLKEHLQLLLESYNIFETYMKTDDWEHCTFGRRDYAPDVLKWIIDGNQMRFKDNIDVDGDKLSEIYDLKKLEALYNNISNSKSADDFNNCLLDKSDKIHTWSKIDKTYFRSNCYSKRNKGNDFEPEYEKMLKDNTENMLTNLFCFLSSYNDANEVYKSKISIETSLDGSKNSKRSLTNFDDEGQELNYVVIKNAKGNVGETLSDITLSLKSSDDKPVTDPVTGIDKLFLSLKSGSTISLINPGVKNTNALSKDKYIFDYNEVSDANIKNFNVPFGNLGKTLLDTFNINHVCFSYIFNNRNIQDGGLEPSDTIWLIDDDTLEKSLKKIYGKVEKTKRGFEVDVTNRNKEIHNLIKLVVGNGYVIVHKLKNGKIHLIDLRDDKLVGDLIGNGIKSAKIVFPYIGTAREGGNKTAARVTVDIDVTENLSIDVVFRNTAGIKKGDPYPSHMQFMYNISDNFQEDRQDFNIEQEIEKELTEK